MRERWIFDDPMDVRRLDALAGFVVGERREEHVIINVRN